MSRERHRMVAVVVAVLLATATAHAQEEPRELFVDRVDVEVVNVEVVVEDRSGERVTGLGVEDFALLVDGEPVEITNFYAADHPDLSRASIAPAAAGTPRAAAELPRIPVARRLHLAVYVDHLNLRPWSQKTALEKLGGFLRDRLQQGDRVMLTGFDGSLRTVTPFTDDPAAIERGLAALAATMPRRHLLDSKLEQTYRSIVMEMSAEMLGAPASHASSYVEAVEHNNAVSVHGLSTLVASLAGLPGRKALVYLSNGLEAVPGQEISAFLAANNLGGPRPTGDPRHLLDDVYLAAQAAQVTLLTVDAGGGVATQGQLSAANLNYTQNDAGRMAHDQGREINLQQPLVDFARETGGRAVLNPAELGAALAEAARDFDVFYSLGYRPLHGGDGELHRVEVKLRRPGLTARHRTAYRDKPATVRVAERIDAALRFGVEDNPLDVVLDVGTAAETPEGHFELPLVVRIPVDRVTFLPQETTYEARLTFSLMVRDPAGGTSPVREIPYEVSVSEEQLTAAAGREVGYSTSLLLRPGTPTVALAVRDELSGEESFLQRAVTLGDAR